MTTEALISNDILQRVSVVEEDPFPHFAVSPAFTIDVADAFLSRFLTDAVWQHNREHFYDQHDFDVLLSSQTRDRSVMSVAQLLSLKNQVAGFFETALIDRVTVVAHRMSAGQGIGVHTDTPHLDRETHRLVLFFNKDFDDSYGGHLILLAGSTPDTAKRAFRPLFNTGVGFALSDRSFHAVCDVVSGDRFSLVFSFWDDRQVPEPADWLHEDSDQPVPAGDQSVSTRLVEWGTQLVPHSGKSLYDHLCGVGDLLAQWNLDADVVNAGRCHSLYGTASFETAILAGRRPLLRSIIGSRAEHLVYLYSILDRAKLYRLLVRGLPSYVPGLLADRDIGVRVSPEVLFGLLAIDLANYLEQAHRQAPIQALAGAELTAYRAISDALPVSAAKSLNAWWQVVLQTP